MRYRHGLTWVEVLVLVILFVAAVAIILPPLSRPTPRGHGFGNQTRVRGIVQNMTVYAAMYNDRLPGIGPDGAVIDATVEGRFKMLVDVDLSPEILVNPIDPQQNIWNSGPFTAANYSYTLPQISVPGARFDSYQNDTDTLTPFVTDRNTGPDAQHSASVWEANGPWEGSVAWGDGHASYEEAPVVTTSLTTDDHLFEAATPDDAYMIHSGQ